MDVDSTLIQDEVIELLAAHAGREAEVAAVTERAMRGELDFAESLHDRVAVPGRAAGGGAGRGPRRDPADARAPAPSCRTLQRLGFTVAVVSGGFLEVVGDLAARARHRPRARQPPGGRATAC